METARGAKRGHDPSPPGRTWREIETTFYSQLRNETQKRQVITSRRAANRGSRRDDPMELLDLLPNWGWSYEIGPSPEEWWQPSEMERQAPELAMMEMLMPPEEFPIFFVD